MVKVLGRGAVRPRRFWVGILSVGIFLLLTGSALAETGTTICVPEAASKQVLATNGTGECPTKTISKKEVKYISVSLPGAVGLATLSKILPHVNYVESGVA